MPGIPRRRMLSLLALTLPAACGSRPAPSSSGPSSGPSLSGPSLSGPLSAPPSSGPALSAPSPSPSLSSPAGAPSPSRAAARGGPVPVRAGEAMLGSYLALGGRSLRQSLALRRRQLGREQRIVHRFYPWDGHIPTAEPDVGRDSVLMVSWHGTAWSAVNDGSSDRLIASVAKKLARMRRPILLRWGWEMNGNWFEWDGRHNGNDPTAYVTAWRRLHRIFRDRGADNVAWVWSPNWNSAPDTSWNRFQRYYPGDDHVDWVGVSGYNFFGESPRTLFGPVCRTYGKRKPIILSETAAVQDRAAWIRKLSAWVADEPAVGAVVWFDTDVQEGSPHNFRFDTDPAALAAYRAMARSPRFAA